MPSGWVGGRRSCFPLHLRRDGNSQQVFEEHRHLVHEQREDGPPEATQALVLLGEDRVGVVELVKGLGEGVDVAREQGELEVRHRLSDDVPAQAALQHQGPQIVRNLALAEGGDLGRLDPALAEIPAPQALDLLAHLGMHQHQGIEIGGGTIRASGDPATMALTSSKQEAAQGDRLIPTSVEIPLNFFPKAPSSNIDGQIISVVNGVTQIGQYNVVVMNRGSNHGLGVGDVLTVWQQGAVVRDRVEGGNVRLPDEEAGTVMVFKTYDRISYGLVMEATQAIHTEDFVRNPT